jgi:hypothetical protein
LNDAQILNLTFTVCMYVMHATMCKALRLEYDDVDERIVEVPVPRRARFEGLNEQPGLQEALGPNTSTSGD